MELSYLMTAHLVTANYPSEKPGPLTVTVDPEYISFSNVRHFDVLLVQAKGENEFDVEHCKTPTLLSTNPIEFTLDWSKCPRAVERPEQLRHMRIEIQVVYKRGGGQQEPTDVRTVASFVH